MKTDGILVCADMGELGCCLHQVKCNTVSLISLNKWPKRLNSFQMLHHFILIKMLPQLVK
jgi:hypothetical protein